MSLKAVLLVVLLASRAAAQQNAALRPNEPARELRIGGGETQSLDIALNAGDFARVRLDQEDIDVGLTIRDPSGALVVEASNSGAFEREFISLVATTAGVYRVEIRPGAADAPSGTYRVSLISLRPATVTDKRHAEADALFTSAGLLRRKGGAPALREAIAAYASARERYVAAGDDWRTAESWNRIGVVHLGLNEYRPALAAFESTLPILDRIGDRRWQGVILNNIGLTQWNLAQGQLALDHYERSLAIRRETGDKSGEASTLFNMALVRNTLGDSMAAIALHQQALPLRRALRDRAGEARTLNSMAVAQRDMGALQAALDNFGLARPIFKSLNDRSGELDVVRGLARTYLVLGDFERAQAFVDEAMALAKALENKRTMSVVQTTAADIALARGDQAAALRALGEAVAVFRALPDRPSEVKTLIRMGNASLALGNATEAQARQAEAAAVAAEIGDLDGIAKSASLRGEIALSQGRPDEAAAAFEQELSMMVKTSDRLGEASARYGLAKSHRALAKLQGALSDITSAIALLESMRATVVNPDLRTSYRARTQRYYDLLIDVRMRLHDLEPGAGHAMAALVASERSRARGLLESLGGNLALIREDADPALAAARDEKLRRLNALEYRRTRVGAGAAGAVAVPTEAEISAALGDYRDAEGKVLASNPRYAALLAPPDVTADGLQKAVGADAVLVEFALGDARSFAWTVSSAGVSTYVLPARATLEDQARRLQAALTARNNAVSDATVAARRQRLDTADREADQAARDLSELLLSPIAASLSAKRLVFVADGALQLIPFGLLRAARGRLALGATHEIAMLPSAGLLSEIRRPRAQPSGAQVAVVADPVFEPTDPRVASEVRGAALSGPSAELASAGQNTGFDRFSRLRYSLDEARAITALVPTGSKFEAVGFAATREAARSAEVARARIVHFATHGLMNNRQPELSGLVLSLLDEKGAAVDGYFRLHEIYNLRLDAELVVLSSCRSAVGREVKGEGVMALTRGFLAAGAPRVVASLWDVDDRATAELMSQFYRALLVRKQTAAEALQTAQRALAATPRWAAPYYWAGFTLVGDWR